MAGLDPHQPADDYISPQKFASTQHRRWLLLALDESATRVGWPQGVKSVGRLPARIAEDELVLVASAGGAGYESVRRSLVKELKSRVFFLEGGIEAFERFAATRQALFAKAQHGPVQEARCGVR